MISAGSLVTTDWEEKLTMGDRRSCVSGPTWCKVVHVLLPPTPSAPQGWYRVKTMAKWTRRSCRLTGVNINTLKGREKMGLEEDLHEIVILFF